MNILVLTLAAALVSGRVTADGTPLKGVVVSDGHQTVVTDWLGRYRMDSDMPEGYVFISVPSGYEVPSDGLIPQFFTRERRGARFRLKKVDQSSSKIVVLTDMHLTGDKVDNDLAQFHSQYFPSLCRAVKALEGPVYTFCLGDMVTDGKWYKNNFAFPEFLREMEGYPTPLWNVMGNHDNDQKGEGSFEEWESLAEQRFKNEIGPNYYSLNIGGVHFLMLDDIITHGPMKEGNPARNQVGKYGFTYALDARQMAWVKEDLKHVPKDTPLVVCLHVPLYKDGKAALANSEEVLELFREYPSVDIFAGHFHTTRVTEIAPGVTEHIIASGSAVSWKLNDLQAPVICNDGTPAGWQVVSIDDGRLSWQYQSCYRSPGESQMSVEDLGGGEMLIDIFNWDPSWKVSATCGGKPVDLEQIWSRNPTYDRIRQDTKMLLHRPTAFLGIPAPHYFRARVDDPSSFTVTAVDRFGQEYTASAGYYPYPQWGMRVVTVFQKGEAGYDTFRIPAIVRNASGELLAFAEGRRNGAGDTGDIDLVLKRSSDGGHSWGPLQVVWEDGQNVCGNPSPVVDPVTGRVVVAMTWNDGRDSEKAIHERTSLDTRRVFCTFSDDGGRTWRAPRDITSETKLPEWTWYATGPGHAVSFSPAAVRETINPGKALPLRGPLPVSRGRRLSGTNGLPDSPTSSVVPGRIVVPCNHGVYGAEGPEGTASHVIYSDDLGETWHIGGVLPVGNEATAAVLPDGTLLMNMRRWKGMEGEKPFRIVASSTDGGLTFGDWRFDEGLPGPRCQASLLSDGDLLWFSNPSSPNKRVDMTLQCSADEGLTWCREAFLPGAKAAYSDLVTIGDGRLGVIYECGETSPYERIVFAAVSANSSGDRQYLPEGVTARGLVNGRGPHLRGRDLPSGGTACPRGDGRELSPESEGPVTELTRTERIRWETVTWTPDTLGLAGVFSGLVDGKLIVAGGANFPNGMPWEGGAKHWSADVCVLDGDPAVSAGAWKVYHDAMPIPLAYGASAVLPEGLLCIGGNNDQGTSDRVFLIRPDGTVEERDPMPQPLSQMAFAREGNRLWIAGGDNGGRAQRVFMTLDLISGEWKILEPWPGLPRAFAAAAFQSNGQDNCLYILGGRDYEPGSEWTVPRDAWAYNPRLGTWKAVPGEFDTMAGLAVPYGTNHILLIGGCSPANERFNGVRLFHTVTGTLLEYPMEGHGAEAIPDIPVTAALVRDGKGFWLVSGEVAPGVRTPAVLRGTMESTIRPMSGWDYLVIILYFGILAWMGWFFSKRQRSADDYFKGGGRIPWFIAGLSIFGTSLSAITFMAIPAKAYATDWSYMLFNAGIVLVVPLITLVFIPMFRRQNVTTAYEYLEHRFSPLVRVICSAVFIIYQVGRMGVVLLLPAIALNVVTGVNIFVCVGLMGLFSLLYTYMGGIEAVAWTDALQVVVLIGAAVAVVLTVCTGTDGGFGGVVASAAADAKFSLGSLRFDLRQATIWTTLIATVFTNITTYGTDQTIVQRYLTTRTEAEARKGVYTNALLCIPSTLLFFFVGTCLYVYFKANPSELSASVGNPDAILPWYVSSRLPTGVVGLVIAGIFAAAMSTLSASMNSAATAFVTDIWSKVRTAGERVATPSAGETHSPTEGKGDRTLRMAKVATLVIGAIGVAFALVMATWDVKSLWDEFSKILGILLGGLGGLFLLGFTCRRANAFGAVCGLVGCIAVQLTVMHFQAVNLLLYSSVGFISCFVIGWLASLLVPSRNAGQGRSNPESPAGA